MEKNKSDESNKLDSPIKKSPRTSSSKDADDKSTHQDCHKSDQTIIMSSSSSSKPPTPMNPQNQNSPNPIPSTTTTNSSKAVNLDLNDPPKTMAKLWEDLRSLLPSLDLGLTRNAVNTFHRLYSNPNNNILYPFNPVTVKHLTETDTSNAYSRLAIPRSGVMTNDFLTQEEEDLLANLEHKPGNSRSDYIHVLVRGARGRSNKDYNMRLTRWYYTKNNNNNNNNVMASASASDSGWSYVLYNDWNRFRVENGLHQGDLILVVALRRTGDGKLCFAIIDDK